MMKFVFPTRILATGVLAGLMSGLLLGLLDGYLGLLFAQMSIRPFILFTVLYCLSCISVGVILASVACLLGRGQDRQRLFYLSYFACLTYLINFIYLNVRILHGFDFSNLRNVLANLILLGGIFGLAKTSAASKRISALFSSFMGFSQAAILALPCIVYLNHFVFEWPALQQGALLVMGLTLLAVTAPFIIFFPLTLDFGVTPRAKLAKFGFILALILTIPVLFELPTLSAFKGEKYEPSESQLGRVKYQANVIWIVLDGARRDRFSFYGYKNETTPNLSGFVKDAVLFNNCVTAAPWSLPSHASMLTGTYPSKHGAHHSDDPGTYSPLAEANTTVAEALNEYGYHTFGLMARRPVLGRTYGFDQGFHFLLDDPPLIEKCFWPQVFRSLRPDLGDKGIATNHAPRLSGEINEIVFRWFDRYKSDRFFMFINYMDLDGRTNDLQHQANQSFDWTRWDDLYRSIDMEKIDRDRVPISDTEQAALYEGLDYKMRYLDRNLGQLFDKLKKAGLYEDAMIIVTSDHGELYGEHDAFGHKTNLHNEVIYVPLIIKYPKYMKQGGTVSKWVQSIDIMPEILETIEIPLPDEIQGQPLAVADHLIITELFQREPEASNGLPSQRSRGDLKSIYSEDGRFKYIQSSTGHSELYNLVDDPHERNNLAQLLPDVVADFDRKLTDWQRSFVPITISNNDQDAYKKKLDEKLRSLGYLR